MIEMVEMVIVMVEIVVMKVKVGVVVMVDVTLVEVAQALKNVDSVILWYFYCSNDL